MHACIQTYIHTYIHAHWVDDDPVTYKRRHRESNDHFFSGSHLSTVAPRLRAMLRRNCGPDAAPRCGAATAVGKRPRLLLRPMSHAYYMVVSPLSNRGDWFLYDRGWAEEGRGGPSATHVGEEAVLEARAAANSFCRDCGFSAHQIAM